MFFLHHHCEELLHVARLYPVSDEVICGTLAHLAVTPDYVPELKIYLTAITQTFLSKGHITATPDWDKTLDRSLPQKAAKA